MSYVQHTNAFLSCSPSIFYMSPHILLQIGSDLYNTTFVDVDGRTAFTLQEIYRIPNKLVRLRREAPWALQHRDIMGPSDAYFYLGPSEFPGYMVYGNTPQQPMTSVLQRKRASSTSRHFKSQGGKEFKWKLFPDHMECIHRKTVMAVYQPNEVSPVFEWNGISSMHYANLTINRAGLPIVTEILTTLLLIRMANFLGW